jgi:16S rRNA (adenine1518-N6/adenine1519-N6)-dimethyltransferase
MSDIVLPPLREIIAKYDLAARKSLGQNFIFDQNLLAKIVRVAGDLRDKNVYEVGPGPGGLTRAILQAKPNKVIAVEKDIRCIEALQELSAAYPGVLNIENKDALDIDEGAYFTGPTEIIANLPYNVGTALFIRWLSLDPWPGWWCGMTLMFQKEVAQRIVAKPDTSAYGRLAILAQWRSEPKIALTVPREAFTPPPKVTSAIIRLTPKKPLLPIKLTDLENVTAAAFGQRRKMLRVALKGLVRDPETFLKSVDIDPTARAETLSVLQFCQLAEKLAEFR